VLIARGRDATDVAISNTFGPHHSRGVHGLGGRSQVSARDQMRLLTVRHVTTYRYAQPVRFGEHRMMFRPRESHDLRLVSTKLDIVPRPAGVRWVHDVFDNSVAIVTFDEALASELRFDSTVTLELIETTLPDYELEIGAHTYPFHYSDDDQPDLIRALARQYSGDDLDAWTARFVKPGITHDGSAPLDDARYQGRVRVSAPD
jgi:transglutaminase-like putative cysteine protease